MSPDASTRFRFSYLILGLCAAAALGSYIYKVWNSSQQEKALLPRLAADQIIKALRTYQHQIGKFPDNFIELEERVWKHAQAPKFYEEGRGISMHNYYYIYYLVEARVCALWAIPVNKRREEGSTYFLTISPEWVRRWKGAPLTLDEIKRLPDIPTPAQLALLGLTELSPIQTPNSRSQSR